MGAVRELRALGTEKTRPLQYWQWYDGPSLAKPFRLQVKADAQYGIWDGGLRRLTTNLHQ